MKVHIIYVFCGLLCNILCVTSTGDGDIRLTGGDGYSTGTVEIYHDFAWGTICDDDWDIKDATVVCRQLGFNLAIMSRDEAYFGTGHGEILLDDVTCSGFEDRLEECPSNGWYDHNCNPYEAAGVECSNAPFPTTPLYWSHGSVRLLDGSSSNQGRVEVNWGSNWYVVCDDNWDIADATVVCHQLGYAAASEVVLESGFGGGEGDILLDDVMCTGYESSLLECGSNSLFVHDCERNEIAGVVCSLPESAVRLQGGQASNSGRVELYYYDSWATLCDDYWDYEQADVICRQLGFDGVQSICSSACFGPGSGPIMRRLECSGLEYRWNDCSFHDWNTSSCNHQEDAGLTCMVNAPSPTTSLYWSQGSVRLMDGSSRNEGRVEVNWGSNWYVVCDDNWDIADATVVCRQLGYTAASGVVLKSGFGDGEGDILLDDVRCTGYESSLLECGSSGLFVHDCGRNEIAGVVCSLTESAVRLQGGQASNSGRVELYYHDSWTTLCDDYWDYEEADVICRQLGFDGVQSICSSACFGPGSGPIMRRLECTGLEYRWNDCSFHDWNTSSCNHHEDTGVTCMVNDYSGDDDDDDVRLIGSSVAYAGRVEIYYEGTWGTICDDGWDHNDAEVVCNQLGFPGASVAVGNALYGEGFGPILLNGISCKGDEHYLTECNHAGWYIHNCRHAEDAGVQCNVPSTHYPRLVKGSMWYEGRVEVWDGSQWTKLCSDEWFFEDEADAVCKELGFEGVDYIIYDGRFGEGDAPPSDIYYSCMFYQESLSQCDKLSRSPNYYCTSSAVRCKRDDSLSAGAIAAIAIGTSIFICILFVSCAVICKNTKSQKNRRRNHPNVATISGSTNPAGPSVQITPQPAILSTNVNGQAPPSYNDVISNPGYYPNVTIHSQQAAGHSAVILATAPPYFGQSNPPFVNSQQPNVVYPPRPLSSLHYPAQ